MKDRKRKDNILINEEIKTPFIRIVGENGIPSLVDLKTAMMMAFGLNTDLLLINIDKDGVGVCKLMDYSKLVYEKKQKEKVQKQNNKKIKIKEIRLTYNTGDHDFNFKLKHSIDFLKSGDKVKIYVMFSGREIVYRDQGELILLKFIDSLSDIGKAETLPKLDGKKLWAVVGPKK